MAITMPNAMAHTMSTVLTARTMPTCMRVVNHVVHKVYNGNSRTITARTPARMVRRARKPCKGGDISQTCGHQRRNGDAHIQIDTELYAARTDRETCKSGDRGKQKCNPVATEQLAETAAGKTRTDGNEIGGVVPLLAFYLLQLFLVAVERRASSMARQDSLLISDMAVMLIPCFSHF